jgi:uncharacterized protein (UPF0303 family)
MSTEEYIAIVKAQEALLQFSRFSRLDAWKLGNIFVKAILEQDQPVSISIRLTSGLVLFQYAPEGTNLNNQSWMDRKYRTLLEMDESGLLSWLRLKEQGKTLANWGLDPNRNAASGGSFPIRLKGAGIIGAAVVSGLPHFQDHELLVECISRFLKIAQVPRLPPDAE